MRGKSGKRRFFDQKILTGLRVWKAGTSSVFGELVCPARLWRLPAWDEQPPKASRASPKRKQSSPLPIARATIYVRDAFPARELPLGR